MFIAQVDETDVYNKSGQQFEDINSLVQYVAQVLHIKHKPLKDSDDDNARYFHFENLTYFFANCGIELKKPIKIDSKKKYPPHLQQQLSSLYFEIQSPPPEA